jgi:hypothetical protein
MAKQPKPFILIDSAEKKHKRWNWESSKDFAGSRVESLENGDYTLDVFKDEKWLYLEKKGSFYEIRNNLFSEDWERFHACLERIKNFKYKYIIIEASISDVYYQVPPKVKVKPEAVLKKLIEISMDYNVCVMPCGVNAKTVALSILKRSYERWIHSE